MEKENSLLNGERKFPLNGERKFPFKWTRELTEAVAG
jgi:hypothetical protein